MSDPIVVKTVEELKAAPEEYREAVAKLVISHAINELYGAQVFDEPAIALALAGSLAHGDGVGAPDPLTLTRLRSVSAWAPVTRPRSTG